MLHFIFVIFQTSFPHLLSYAFIKNVECLNLFIYTKWMGDKIQNFSDQLRPETYSLFPLWKSRRYLVGSFSFILVSKIPQKFGHQQRLTWTRILSLLPIIIDMNSVRYWITVIYLASDYKINCLLQW